MSPGSKGEHVVCVYNPDYQDTNQVMRVENLLRSAGAVGDLLYKPDIFSTLGIYRNNKWGFRPTIYTSRVILNEGRSKINIVGSEKFYINSSKGFEKPDSLDMQKVNKLNMVHGISVIDIFSSLPRKSLLPCQSQQAKLRFNPPKNTLQTQLLQAC